MHPLPRRDDELLGDLNEAQRAAVLHRDGPLLVVAGPGSGKTRVITRRAAYLVRAGVSPRNVLAITFTNKAAGEMRRRIEQLGVARGMWIYTFHALGVRLLREFGSLAGVEGDFSIYDEDDSLRVVKQALDITQVSDFVLKPDDARARISDAKNQLLAPEALTAEARYVDERAFARVYATYQSLLTQQNAVDFDDLLLRVARLLGEHADVTERLNVRFRYVLIDEYQDTNHAQYLIARSLARHHQNICATGDPDQSIYAWRGADIRNILEFERDFPNATVVRLEQNYRSTQHICRVASQLIRWNQQRKLKDIWTGNTPGAPVTAWQFASSVDEAEQIARAITEAHVAGRPYNDLAIFYRVNAVSRGLEDALRARGIPYRIARGVEFYNRAEVRDALAYLRILANPRDDLALLRIINTPPRGIGRTTVERLRTHANETNQPLLAVVRGAAGAARGLTPRVQAFAQLYERLHGVLNAPVHKIVELVLLMSGLENQLRESREVGGEDRLANVQELVTAALRYQQEHEAPSLAGFLHQISLVSDQDFVDEHAGVVHLMTLHAAKGLEFPVVFLVGLEQGLLPHDRALTYAARAGRELEEERRLCFVGLTRAREELYLSWARERTLRGRYTPRTRSQFIAELDDSELTWRDFQPAARPPVPRSSGEGFVPLLDDLPPDEARRYVGGARRLRQAPTDDSAWRQEPDDALAADPNAPAPPPPDESDRVAEADRDAFPAQAAPPDFTAWGAGTLVRHAHYGLGVVCWIQRAPGKTRAGVHFSGHGEKVLFLEFAPIRRA